jgi:hypothetical protein
MRNRLTKHLMLPVVLAVGVTGCATTVTAENVIGTSDLRLCRIEAQPGSRELTELDLVRSELARRATDCAAVFDAERARQEAERARLEEERRIAEEARLLREERQVERFALALEQAHRPARWGGPAIPPNTQGITPNACLYDEANDHSFPADIEAMNGDQLNYAVRGRDFEAYRQYAVVYWERGVPSVIEMDQRFSSDALPYGYARGVDADGRVWHVAAYSRSRCGL